MSYTGTNQPQLHVIAECKSLHLKIKIKAILSSGKTQSHIIDNIFL